jgi:hypothetical protein
MSQTPSNKPILPSQSVSSSNKVRSLPFDQWPEADRAAWATACRSRDLWAQRYEENQKEEERFGLAAGAKLARRRGDLPIRRKSVMLEAGYWVLRYASR